MILPFLCALSAVGSAVGLAVPAAIAAPPAQREEVGAREALDPGFEGLLTEWDQAEAAWDKSLHGARGEKRRELENLHPTTAFFPRFEEWARHGEGRAVLWMASNAHRLNVSLEEKKNLKQELFRRLVAHHANEPWFVQVVETLPDQKRWFGNRATHDLLHQVFTSSSDLGVQARAGWELAQLLDHRMKLEDPLPVYRQLVRDFKDTREGRLAAERLYFLEYLDIGRPAPSFEGKDVDGRSVRLADYRGKVVVLDFYGFWCAPCRAELPNLRVLAERYRNAPFAVLGVNTDRGRSDVRSQCEAFGVTWPSVYQGGKKGALTKLYRIESYPTILVIDEEGIIRHRGVRGPSLVRAVEEMMAGKPGTRPGR